MKPIRIQRKRTRGWRMPENTVAVDRTTGFGNPFPIEKGKSTSMGQTEDVWIVGTWTGPGLWFCKTAEEAQSLSVRAYEGWLNLPAQSALRERATQILHGRNLMCWCRLDQPCHADVLLELANK
jgi:hypothetical protein